MDKDIFELSKAKVGREVKVYSLKATGLLRQRMLDLGIVPNSTIFILRRSPWKDPTAYIIKDTCIALRKEEANKILVYYIN